MVPEVLGKSAGELLRSRRFPHSHLAADHDSA